MHSKISLSFDVDTSAHYYVSQIYRKQNRTRKESRSVQCGQGVKTAQNCWILEKVNQSLFSRCIKILKMTFQQCLVVMYSVIYILGIERLIDHFLMHKIPIAVATGNSEYEFSLKEKGHSEFFKKFHHKVM